MDDLANSIGVKWAALVAGVLTLAASVPKILNMVKGDLNNGNVLDRLSSLEKKADIQDKKIHKQAVRITKLVMLVIKLEALIVRSGVQIDKGLADEILARTADEELGE
jgi:hypothetical protein